MPRAGSLMARSSGSIRWCRPQDGVRFLPAARRSGPARPPPTCCSRSCWGRGQRPPSRASPCPPPRAEVRLQSRRCCAPRSSRSCCCWVRARRCSCPAPTLDSARSSPRSSGSGPPLPARRGDRRCAGGCHTSRHRRDRRRAAPGCPSPPRRSVSIRRILPASARSTCVRQRCSSTARCVTRAASPLRASRRAPPAAGRKNPSSPPATRRASHWRSRSLHPPRRGEGSGETRTSRGT